MQKQVSGNFVVAIIHHSASCAPSLEAVKEVESREAAVDYANEMVKRWEANTQQNASENGGSFVVDGGPLADEPFDYEHKELLVTANDGEEMFMAAIDAESLERE